MSPILLSDHDDQMKPNEGSIARGPKADEKEISKMMDDIDHMVQNIKNMNKLSNKEEAEVEKTLSILRSQLNPKKRKKKEAFKKFNFAILKSLSSPRNINN